MFGAVRIDFDHVAEGVFAVGHLVRFVGEQGPNLTPALTSSIGNQADQVLDLGLDDREMNSMSLR